MIGRYISHIPSRHFKMVRYYGFLSNRKRGDHFGIKRAVLIRNMCVNLHTRLLAVLEIDLTGIAPVTAYPKRLMPSARIVVNNNRLSLGLT